MWLASHITQIRMKGYYSLGDYHIIHYAFSFQPWEDVRKSKFNNHQSFQPSITEINIRGFQKPFSDKKVYFEANLFLGYKMLCSFL